MAGLCEGGNEPPGSLKAVKTSRLGTADHLDMHHRPLGHVPLSAEDLARSNISTIETSRLGTADHLDMHHRPLEHVPLSAEDLARSNISTIVPAQFKSRAVNQSGVAGEGLVLVCEAEDHRETDTTEQHLESLTRRDTGPYCCSASNDFRQDEMIVYLTAKGYFGGGCDLEAALGQEMEDSCEEICINWVFWGSCGLEVALGQEMGDSCG
ncbi:hypothetical protein ANN_02447 [Periplaneta americana]|uniref:Uncharacterized protein n=1 Tax=Periplaneta americana TaxID=6978 RepID=A0ABQ8TXY5_PERAM|nr:hypothetical protein ANN_02447 [Periplaneta americana]